MANEDSAGNDCVRKKLPARQSTFDSPTPPLKRWATRSALAAVFVGVVATLACAQAPAPDVGSTSPVFRTAREAVREGNQLLRAGQSEAALRAYEQAKHLDPEALEIPFVQGLSEYQLKEYEAARTLWDRAVLSEDAGLADAATYSLGTTYHAQALVPDVKPEDATKLLEKAMERYQQVLTHDPQHLASRDSLHKAAALRRQIKELQQPQQQPNQQQENSEEKEDDSSEKKEQQQSAQNEKQPSASEPSESQESQEQQSSEQQEKQEQSSESPESTEQKEDQGESSSPKDEQQPVDPSQADQEEGKDGESTAQQDEEQLSREQAERQLREMMQSMRDRQKQRRDPAKRVPIKPAEKDW